MLREIAHRLEVYAKQHGIDGELSVKIGVDSVDDFRRLQGAITNEFKDVIWNVPGWLTSDFHAFKLNGINWNISFEHKEQRTKG